MIFDVARFAEERATRGLTLGSPFVATDVTESTNDDAMTAARAGAPHGALYLAEEQIRGRGRRGREWTSAPGENLTFSVVLRPKLALEHASAFTLVVGLAVREGVALHAPPEVTVKWPNDVYARGKKVGGILVESQIQGSELAALVVGIGLNVHTVDLPDHLVRTATSLALLESTDVSREALLLDVLDRLARNTEEYVRHGLATFLPELRRHDELLGRRVAVDGMRGIAAGIDADGALLLDLEDGRRVAHRSGSVELG